MWFSYCSSRDMPFREWNFAFRESVSELSESFENGLFIRSQKLQNENSPNFSNFRPEFGTEFCSNFPRNSSGVFRASFRGKRRPDKLHQRSPPFFNANSQATSKKKSTKVFWRAGKVTSHHSESIFPEIGVVPGLLLSYQKKFGLTLSESRKRGVEFKGGSRHNWNCHDRRNRQNRQNHHEGYPP